MSSETATTSTGWSYSPMFDITNSAERSAINEGRDQLHRQTIRRRFSARLKNISQNKPESFVNTENMLGLPQLRGKYNHALFFDG